MYDFSSGLALLNSGIDSIDKKLANRRDTDALLAAYDQSQGGVAPPAQSGSPLARLGQMFMQPQPQQPRAPQPAQAMPAQGPGGLGDLFARKEAELGLPPGYLQRTAAIESSGNPNAQNPNSSAGGLFQFIDSTAKQYGLTNKMDPVASTEAAARLAADNKAVLSRALGREPTAGELYLAHQQGGGGATKLLANPNARAVDVVGADAVRLNGGNPNMTAAEFASRWVSKVDGGQPGQPVQMASADAPAMGAAEAQGFAVPGGPPAAAAAAARQGINPQMIRSLLANPGTREIGKALWQQTMTGKSFGFQVVGDQLYRTNPQTGAVEPVGVSKPVQPVTVSPGQRLVDPRTGQVVYEGGGGFKNLTTPEERASFGIAADDRRPYQVGPDGKLVSAGGAQTNVNVDTKGEGKFDEKMAEGQAKRYNEYIAEGDVAQGRLADIQTLRETSRRLGSQGSSANLKALIGPYAESLNIPVDGLSDIQLYESITQRLAPTLRAAGSGSTSDIEFKGFQRAIGPLSNTPAAREMILDTFEAASRNDLARAEIASRLARKEINRGQAEKEIRALPNPLEGFRKYREANPDAVGQAIKESAQRQALERNGPPKISSPEMAGKLPSGTEFIDPNGVKRRVP